MAHHHNLSVDFALGDKCIPYRRKENFSYDGPVQLDSKKMKRFVFIIINQFVSPRNKKRVYTHPSLGYLK